MPLVRPVMVQEPEAPVMVQVSPPGLAVTVCEVAGYVAPAVAVTVMVADALPATAVGAAGATGIYAPLVITRLLVPLMATATNSPLPYATDDQGLLAAEVRLVHVVPSGLVIT